MYRLQGASTTFRQNHKKRWNRAQLRRGPGGVEPRMLTDNKENAKLCEARVCRTPGPIRVHMCVTQRQQSIREQ
jgi:hypothetical protein